MNGRARHLLWKAVEFLACGGGIGYCVPPPSVLARMNFDEADQPAQSAGPRQPANRIEPRELDAWLASVLGTGPDRSG